MYLGIKKACTQRVRAGDLPGDPREDSGQREHGDNLIDPANHEEAGIGGQPGDALRNRRFITARGVQGEKKRHHRCDQGDHRRPEGRLIDLLTECSRNAHEESPLFDFTSSPTARWACSMAASMYE
jgi:hypothetical protein